MSKLKQVMRLVGVCGVMSVCGMAMGMEPPTATAPASAPAAKPAAGLPSGKEVLAKYIAATGGEAAYRKIKTQKLVSTMEIPAQGLKGTVTVEQNDQKQMRTEMDFGPIGLMSMGFDGTVGWSNSAMQGPQVLKGPELDQARQGAEMYRELTPDTSFASVETVGEEKVGDAECYKVVVTPKTGKPETRFYDKASGLLVKTTSVQVSQMGEIPVESLASDYREVEGLKLPFAATQKMMGMEMKMIVNKVTFNEPIAADRFELPADVKKLLEPKKTDEKKPDEAKDAPKKGG